MSPDILAICLFVKLECQLASAMCILFHHRLLTVIAFEEGSWPHPTFFCWYCLHDFLLCISNHYRFRVISLEWQNLDTIML